MFWIGIAGLVLQTLILGGGGLIFLMRLEGKQDKENALLSLRMQTVETNTQEIKQTIKTFADQSVRINYMEKLIDDLRRGRGWINDSVSGEYSRRGQIKPGE